MKIKIFFFSICLLFLNLIHKVNSSLQFEILPDRLKCYIEELYKGSVMMVKWKIAGLIEPDEQKAKMFLAMINIQIIQESSGIILKRDILKTEKGKFSFHNDGEMQQFKICVSYHGGWTIPYPVVMGIKIASDNMDEPNIKTALKAGDVNYLNDKARYILEAGRNMIEKQLNETEVEVQMASKQINTSRYYYNTAVLQILMILALGIYQVFMFRKFLVNKHVI